MFDETLFSVREVDGRADGFEYARERLLKGVQQFDTRGLEIPGIPSDQR
jgi:hypothetical protein